MTAAFERNLARIEQVLDDAGASQRFEELVDDLLERVIPLLESTPALGAPLSNHTLTEESRLLLDKISRQVSATAARQLVRGDFVMLYVVSEQRVHLLAVRHHREANFRFEM
ncbi:MAG: type II toxin-antitoxin system RelE/ParE family toxin [Myxococcaceae bacterium]|nr:type II toxin-antitoxin system RelE/ParE family toxin [Myxococcaceae bacterium]